MNIKLTKKQLENLLNEAGGYDDPFTGMRDEKAIVSKVVEAYMHLRQGMDMLGELKQGIVVQDRLREDLGQVRNLLVEPMNEFADIMVKIFPQSGLQGQMDDGGEMDLDEAKKKRKVKRKVKRKTRVTTK